MEEESNIPQDVWATVTEESGYFVALFNNYIKINDLSAVAVLILIIPHCLLHGLKK